MARNLGPTNQTMQGLARVIGPGVSPHRFILLTFETDAPAGTQTNYVGNLAREDAVKAMKEIIERWEKG